MTSNDNDTNNISELSDQVKVDAEAIESGPSNPLSKLWQGFSNLLRSIFGQWDYDAPPWMRHIIERVRVNPRRALTWFGVGFALVAGVWWWTHRPKVIPPDAVTFTVTAPRITNYTDTPPTIHALSVDFSKSVAPLKAIDKPAVGVVIEPSLVGTWTWVGDSQLEFKPQNDWPVGTTFQVKLDPNKTVAPQIKLAETEFEFDTAPFTLQMVRSEFYQDPIDPKLKKAVFELKASHPIDAGTFESRVNLNMRDADGAKLDAPSFTASYDDKRLQITLQSSPLQLPENGGVVGLAIADGAQALLGGKGQQDKLESQVNLPARFSLAVSSANAIIVDNSDGTPEQVLVVELNQDVRDMDVAKTLEAFLLPRQHPDAKNNTYNERGELIPYGWDYSEVSDAVLNQAKTLPLELIPGERDIAPAHSFRFAAEPDRRVYLRMKKGLTSFGGFVMGKDFATVIGTPDFPKLVRFVGEGALLSMRGEQRVTLALRNVREVEFTVARVAPKELHHLVQFNQQGMKNVDLSPMTADDVSERFRQRISVPEMKAGEVHYEGVDLSKYWTESNKGVFLLSVREVLGDENDRNPEQHGSNYNEYYDEECYECDGENAGQIEDKRMVVLTDLGVISKTTVDQSRDVFVQRLHSGEAAAGARVSVIARNGASLLTRDTDANGQARIPELSGFKNEQRPIMLLVESNGDMSFLPLHDAERTLDMSRFDIGGEINPSNGGELKAHLFSDRGIYRPGDTFHIGMIVRAADWRDLKAGMPLRATIHDARGNEARKVNLSLNAEGFMEIDHVLSEVAPTGVWSIDLAKVIQRDGAESHTESIGSLNIRVKEFLPDRMKLSATLSSGAPNGWVKPDGLKVALQADNLIGTPAQNRRATGKMMLTPMVPSFAKHPGFVFYDQRKNADVQELALGEQQTDDTGKSTFELNLQNVSAPTFTLTVNAEVFEADGGRSVTAQTSSLVSRFDYLVGLKSVDSLQYVQRNAKRALDVLALNADGNAVAVEGLTGVVIEKRYVSVLTKQNSGLYRYQSVLKEIPVNTAPIVLKGGVSKVSVPTNQPGSFVFFVRDGEGNTLNAMSYEVAGEGNVARSLDRNAELSLRLSKDEYSAGEVIELNVRAPYTGAGLITIERDRVYASKWFKADNKSSVQTIQLPAEFSGNGYVNVQFLRDPQSAEVFMSPLSYGVAAFRVDRKPHTRSLSLTAPAKIKPGQILPITLTTDGAAKVAVFAVDEGILQVANYKLADPLDTFLAKKSLQVDTAQILDLLLPEFAQLLGAAAPGGDAEAALARNLNPFKRKTDKPAVYWAGLTDVDGTQVFNYQTPDSFNGKLRLMAVAVHGERIGITQSQALVRGDFVLSPNLPTAVAPGDEFEASVGVAFPPPDGAEKVSAVDVNISAKVGNGLTVLDGKPQQLKLQPGSESIVRIRVRANQALGPQSIQFNAQGIGALGAAKTATRKTELSVRPLTPYLSGGASGRIKGKSQNVQPLRTIWPNLAKRDVVVAHSPLVMMRGLDTYLEDFPHYCSEQLISKAIPALVAGEHPDIFAMSPKPKDFSALNEVLASRQNGEGGFGLWTATPQSEPFVSVYAGLYFVEAEERGFAVPNDLVENNLRYLQTLAANTSTTSLDELRVRALAAYVLTRRGQVATPYLAGLEQALNSSHGEKWKTDSTATLIAAIYAQMQQDKVATQRLQEVLKRLKTPFSMSNWWNGYYDDPAIQDALSMYLLARHFPATYKLLPPTSMERLVMPIENGMHNTLSSAMTVLALSQMAKTPGAQDQLAAIQLSAIDAKKVAKPFGAVKGWMKYGKFDASAVAVSIDKVTPPTWYALNDTGFDRNLPTQAISEGIEVLREYQYASGASLGKPVMTMKQGDEIDVVLRLRSTDGLGHYSLAIIDLLPGGFELVEQNSTATSNPNSDGNGGASASVSGKVALAGSDLLLTYMDMREDRLVLYAASTASVQTFKYRIKATSAGTFKVAPIYANDMYDRRVKFIGGAAGSLQVTR